MSTKTVLQIENIEAGEIINRLDRMESAINVLTANPQSKANEATQTEYITRNEVAKLFKISLVTVHDWTKKGILQAYKIGRKVYFKQSEVEKVLVKKGCINATK